ncbi:MAG: Ribophorin I-domain-containing protein [Monoraphidium minutum]|nr:MAG: Ribophorin I-domain-containing protein [Monoraphidium minutum]
MWAARALLLALALCSAHADLVIKNAERKINLKSQIAKVTDTLELAAEGAAATSVLLCYPGRLAARQARLRVTVNKDAFDATRAAAPPGAPAGTACFSAAVAVPRGDSVTLEAAAAFTGAMAPNPPEVKQFQPQLMEYEDTLRVLSPYKAEKQATTVVLPTSTVAGFSPSEGGSHKGGKVVWEDLGPAGPWADAGLRVHFHHDKAFKKVVKLVREIEVSHWGNIYVEEHYVIANGGAAHTGPFSRLEYAMDPGRTNAFQEVRAHLPPSSHSLYYKDGIGNISSSNTITGHKETVLSISLRYPLMGGWKTDFMLGYSVPLDNSLFRQPKGRNRLIMDLSTPLDDVVVEELETRVVLPEGATRIEHTLPFDLDVSEDVKFTYLNTRGRPVLVLRKRNLTPAHNKPFIVDYTFGAGALMREPLLLITAFAALFAAVAVWHRLEFTISKDAKWAEARAGERAAATLQQLGALWDGESQELERLSGVTDALADTVGIEAANNARHAAEGALKDLDARARALIEELDGSSAKAASAAREHAERGKALQQRALKLMSEKCDQLRKGVGAGEAARRLYATAAALADARAEWDAATFSMCD